MSLDELTSAEIARNLEISSVGEGSKIQMKYKLLTLYSNLMINYSDGTPVCYKINRHQL